MYRVYCRPEDNRTVSISKKKIYEVFKEVCGERKWLLGDSYFESKQKAVEYQRNKLSLFQRLQQLGFSTWLKKPQELEYFS